MARKDNRGRNLRTGEGQRPDGHYLYRYTDSQTGKRESFYHTDLAELRKMEKEVARDMDDGIATASDAKKMEVNTLFEKYLSVRKLSDSTRSNYVRMWDIHIKDDLGKMKVMQVRPSHIKALFQAI